MTAAVALHLREDGVAKAEADFAAQTALVANDIQLAFGQTFELLRKQFAVILDLGRAHVPAGREHVTLLTDCIECD